MTSWLLMTFPTWALFVLIIGIPTLAVGIAIVAFRRRAHWERLMPNNEIGGLLFSIVGTIYAIFLAFLVVVAWEQLGETEQNVAQEAATLVSLHRDLGLFAEPGRTQLREQLRHYGRTIVDDEWDALAGGEESAESHESFEQIWRTFATVQPTGAREVAAYSEGLARLNDLGKLRDLRIHDSSAAIPDVFWLVLLFGATVTIGFTFFLGMSDARSQVLLTAGLTAMIMAALFLIVILDRPFTGEVRTDPGAFVDALKEMRP